MPEIEMIEQAKEEVAKLRGALVGLVGSDDVNELKAMELTIRVTPAPEADKAKIINAIHALIETAAQ